MERKRKGWKEKEGKRGVKERIKRMRKGDVKKRRKRRK